MNMSMDPSLQFKFSLCKIGQQHEKWMGKKIIIYFKDRKDSRSVLVI
jgi:hypothetical protein